MKHNTYFNFYPNLSIKEKIDLIKETMFSGVFLFYDQNIDEIVKEVRSNNLEIETIHLDFENCNHLWLDTIEAIEFIEKTKAGIYAAYRNNISSVIFHVSSKENPPLYNMLGINRLREILNICEELNINFVLENLRRLDYLDYIYDNLKSEKLKFCFDSGHANAFTKNIETFDFKKYQDRLICIHLSDNFGEHDSHLIPFMGNIDFCKLGANLKEIGFKGPLTSEAIIKKSDNILEDLKKVKKSLEKIEEYFR